MSSNSIRIMQLLLVGAMLGGCSVFDATVEPAYDRRAGTEKLSAPAHLHLINVTSTRSWQYEGVKKNEFGMVIAKIATKSRPERLVARALALELEGAGFKVNDRTARRAVQLACELQQFFVEPEIQLLKGNVTAVVKADLTVCLPGGAIYRRSFKGIGNVYSLMWYSFISVWSDHLYAAAFELALQDFTKKTVRALVELVSSTGRGTAPPAKKQPAPGRHGGKRRRG